MPWPSTKQTPVIGRDLPHGTPRDQPSPTAPDVSWSRPLVEFLTLVLAGVLVSRVFVVEAYIVPTGSMAPTLLGAHRDLFCPNCATRFALGLDTEGEPAGRPICPNCGHSNLAAARAIDSPGDRLLVHKHTFVWRPPHRWEIAVFQGPGPEHEAFVKRIVALPSESVQIRDGDLWIDGALARKALADVRALRLPVYDHDLRPSDYDLYPRWLARRGDPADPLPSGWVEADSVFSRSPPPGDAPEEPRIDWLEYQHWEPDTLRAGPVRDFVGYNGAGNGGDHALRDLILEFQVSPRPDCPAIELAIASGRDHFQITLPVDGRVPAAITLDGRLIPASPLGPGLASSPDAAPRWSTVEASVVDRRLLVAVEGQLAFGPIDLESPNRPAPRGGRLAVGVSSGSATVRRLRVFRDVFYTADLAGSMRPPHAVNEPYRLGTDEYFVLGDNSPVSHDSRFWENGPIVPGWALVGRPFLVHVPSQVVPVQLFGRDLFWIPDPREIRYIR